ncbi:MAG: T9SS type A sorting domain-containing protein [Bacteroidales bacterium]|nr:T9SS type A sorting domain-containing protein [Bacteroidales bacterium]
MKTFLLISFCIGFLTTQAQISSSCELPSVLQAYYDKDVKEIASKRIFAQDSPYSDSIEIPQNYQDTIWEGLAAIFNVTGIPERDSVFDFYCIHQYVCYHVYNTIFIRVDPSYPWTSPWASLETHTGNPDIDNLTTQYGFTVTNYWSAYDVVTLETEQNINTKALCLLISEIEGVVYAEISPYYGDGNEINYEKIGNDRYYDFVVGFGDCPSGCTSSRTFKFKVFEDCSVQYWGTVDYITGGDQIPPPTNCMITERKQMNKISAINLYPNPTDEYIIPETNFDIFNYHITNVLGEILRTGVCENNSPIFVKDLNKGVYFLRILDNNTQLVVKKFIRN